jgi:hypothetical protein
VSFLKAPITTTSKGKKKQKVLRTPCFLAGADLACLAFWLVEYWLGFVVYSPTVAVRSAISERNGDDTPIILHVLGVNRMDLLVIAAIREDE